VAVAGSWAGPGPNAAHARTRCRTAYCSRDGHLDNVSAIQGLDESRAGQELSTTHFGSVTHRTIIS
jgi:hypothetical protein